MAKNVVMKDIANALGISIVSVSKALSDKEGVSEDVRKKIHDKAAELGYKYENSKRDMQSVSGNIGIIVANHFFDNNSFYTHMYKELLIKCTSSNYTGILEIVGKEDEKNCKKPRLVHERKVDGVILMGEFKSDYVNMIEGQELPYMLLDFHLEDFDSDSVISDGTYGTAKLTSLLIENGFTKIGFVGSILATSSIMDRYLGYCKTLLRNNIKINDDWIIADRNEDGFSIDMKLPEEMPEAFVCNSDESAYFLCEKLKGLGYKIPEDISITGFDNFRFATLCTPELTTFKVDINGMTSSVVDQLIRKIRGKNIISGRTIIAGKCIIRDSVAKK